MPATRRYAHTAVAMTLLASLAACDMEPTPPAGPIPLDKQEFIGVWEQESGDPDSKQYKYVIARIGADGRMTYKRQTISGSSSRCMAYNASGIQEIGEGGIRAETIFGIDLNFTVEQPPREEGGQWTMILDGDRLVRTRPQPRAGAEQLGCDEGEDGEKENEKTSSRQKSA
ncbi:MAG: hypothetical protein R3174_12990 [Gammaproteobacteria bacterium]|nr:hypothetical protein [Gammaproteobacteria bacterium]